MNIFKIIGKKQVYQPSVINNKQHLLTCQAPSIQPPNRNSIPSQKIQNPKFPSWKKNWNKQNEYPLFISHLSRNTSSDNAKTVSIFFCLTKKNLDFPKKKKKFFFANCKVYLYNVNENSCLSFHNAVGKTHTRKMPKIMIANKNQQKYNKTILLLILTRVKKKRKKKDNNKRFLKQREHFYSSWNNEPLNQL